MTALSAHAELAEAGRRVKSEPTMEAFDMSDKDDMVSRKIIATWKHCNVLAPNLSRDFDEGCVAVLAEAKDSGWDILAGVVRHKQNKIDELMVDRTEALRKVAGGGEDGASWKEGLENASFEEVEQGARVLWGEKSRGTTLQQNYKNLFQVGSEIGLTVAN